MMIGPFFLEEISIVDRGWCRTSRALQTLQKSTLAYHTTVSLSMKPFGGYGKGPRPSTQIPRMLASSLLALPKVAKLVLDMPVYHTTFFQKAFKDRAVVLPDVETLVQGPYMEWIVAMCPNVEIIAPSGSEWPHTNVDGNFKHRLSFDLIEAAGRADKLRHFELYEYWDLTHLWAIRKAMPAIKSLGMPGGRYNDGITKLLPILAHVHNHGHLVLPSAISLRYGFNPPGSGNVYMGPIGHASLEQVAEEMREATVRVVNMVFCKLTRLTELWIGDDSKATVSRTPDGSISDITWSYEIRQRPNGGSTL